LSRAGPPPGSIVGGKYRVVRLLGQGGMGAVFEAENTVTGKRVAIKWMHPHLADNTEASQRFVREAQASARVRHPNVVDVYDVVDENDGLFLVMEFLEGESLSALMQREGTPLPYVMSLIIAAMRGVAATHREGVIHRDIKPDNIFLAREGDDRLVPKVLDFGISKVSGSSMSITNTGATLGTPLYMSVEQLSGVKDIDVRTDVYAFAVIVYQIVTGQPPFMAETFPVLITKIMTEEARDPRALRPDVPKSLARLITWAMAKDRSHRLPDMETFIRELEPFSTERGFRQQMTLAGGAIPFAAASSDEHDAARDAGPIAATMLARPATELDTMNPVTRPSYAVAIAASGRRGLTMGLAIAALLSVVALIGWLALRPSPPTAALAPVPVVKPEAKLADRPGAAPSIVAVDPPAVPAIAQPAPAATNATPTPTGAREQAMPARGQRAERRERPMRQASATAQPSATIPAPAAEVPPIFVPTPTAEPIVPAKTAPATNDEHFRAGKPARSEF
jgi:tRNA A-37 threonylcarbamoyl transferase component Bud32